MKRLMIFMTFMAFGTWLVYFLSVGPSTLQEEPTPPQPVNRIQFSDVVFRQQVGSQLQMEFLSRESLFDEVAESALLDGVNFTVFEVEGPLKGQVAFEGRADQARLDGKKDLIVLSGNVEIREARGVRIHTELMEYREQRKTLISPGAVTIRSAESVHEGESMIYDLNRKKITLKKPVFYQ